MSSESIAHGDLHLLASQLRAIHAALADFRPPAARPPILDSCTPATLADAPADDWLHAPAIPGLKQLRDALKIDLDGLQRFLDDPASARLPPLSTNAPYLIAVYNEVLCAPPPVVSVFKAFPPPTDSEQKTKAKMSGTPVKVDVVADGGRRWVRVNTIKNARLMAEFRELDSYLTDSDSDEDADDGSASNNINRPSRAQPELDNSLLRMGRALLAAASVSASASASAHAPKVTLRLTRLDPSAPDGADPRVGQTLAGLRAMGIDVQLGERPFLLPTCNTPLPPAPAPTRPLVPTQNINLDLSVLIALVSDLTHAPLPPSLAAAHRRFVPASASSSNIANASSSAADHSNAPSNAAPSGAGTSNDGGGGEGGDLASAAESQIMRELRQEMGGGAFFDVLRARLPLNTTPPADADAKTTLQFWTTADARARFERIVGKIGGPAERRRAGALFAGAAASPSAVGEASASAGDPGGEGGQGEGSNGEAEGAEERFWKDSRYAPGYVPLLPVRVYPSDSEDVDVDEDEPTTPPFFRALADTCRAILAAPPPPAPTASASAPSKSDAYNKKKAVSNNGFPRETTPAPRASARLTAHTVASVRAGAARGWTTLTANRTSVRALLREVGVRGAGVGAGEVSAQEKEDAQEDKAALWLVDPRSLAEGARERAEASYAALEAP